jgi:hypothetical protein
VLRPLLAAVVVAVVVGAAVEAVGLPPPRALARPVVRPVLAGAALPKAPGARYPAWGA